MTGPTRTFGLPKVVLTVPALRKDEWEWKIAEIEWKRLHFRIFLRIFSVRDGV